VLVPGFTEAGITAVIIIGDGKVQTPEFEGETDTFNALFLRLNPEDYPSLIKGVKLSKMEEPSDRIINRARHILDEGLQRSFHVNEFAIIPPRDTMTLRIHTGNHGVLHYVNRGVGFGRAKPPSPNSAQMFYEMGDFDYRRGNIERAERNLSKALRIEPRQRWVEARARYTLGLIYRDKGERERAREQFKKVVEMRVSENLVDAAEKALAKLERADLQD
jgi:tetratricopeptide (TPR) repeat protein